MIYESISYMTHCVRQETISCERLLAAVKNMSTPPRTCMRARSRLAYRLVSATCIGIPSTEDIFV